MLKIRDRRQQLWMLILPLVGTALGGDQAEPAKHAPRNGPIVLRRCVLDYKRNSLLGSNQSGVLAQSLVSVGARVKAGQMLGHLNDTEFRAELELRAFQAASDISIRVAEAKHKLALTKLQRTKKLVHRDFASAEQLNIDTQDEEVERFLLAEARYERTVAELQRKQTEASIRSLEIKSPHDGVVVEMLKVPGQSVSINDPIMRVVDPKEIRATGYLDVTDAWRVRPGQPVRVWADISGAELDIEKEAFLGRVEYVYLEVSQESRTTKVTAVVSNRDELLRSGLEARMEIDLSVLPIERAKTER